jgi:molybdopterin synthase catalytic subunit/molybdopterin converting factor small subunit
VPTVAVRLFAGLRERAGTATREIVLPDGACVGDVWAALDLGDEPPGIACAVNRAYVERDHVLTDGDEVALIPPVSGGAPRIEVVLTGDDIDLAAGYARVGDDGAGALASFVGTVRDRTGDRAVIRLEYEAYEEMAVEELRRIASAAAERHALIAVDIVHRTGVVPVGGASVAIVCSAPHRRAALSACAEIIEELKVSVPIWKREVYADGAVWVGMGS